jgi:predicted transcriptional regulator
MGKNDNKYFYAKIELSKKTQKELKKLAIDEEVSQQVLIGKAVEEFLARKKKAGSG